MKRYYALSVIGKDRPGIVAEVSGLIYDCGGNLEDSSMTRLGGQFAMLVLLSGSGEEFAYRLSTGCKRLEWDKRFSIFLTPVDDLEKTPSPGKTEAYELSTTGLDRMGIVSRTSRLLADEGINIADMQTKATPSPESGTPIFTMKILLEVPPGVSAAGLLEKLNRLGEELAIDISLKRRAI
ncbi:MAG TPA: ACT domain-containing protein [Thermodesulfobacteriota bacterium]|nr:ACT domain-containing protein [Thermodesulfobacteriota bacterium]